MRLTTFIAGALLSAASAVAAAAAAPSVPTISAVGNKLFYENGTQFYIKGIAYQLSNNDPLTDGAQCALDVALMKTLGANTIRVYHVDANSDHSECMTQFANAGIYTLIDLDTFDTYILQTGAPGPTWNQTQLSRFSAVMDSFSSYNNVLGFFVGNEVIAQTNQSLAAPYIKAAARDMKAYRASKNYRDFLIGYSAADIAELRPMLQDYLTCGGNTSENIDFFSLNSYEWCDPSSYTGSGYSTLEDQAKNFPVPIFFSETGCNVPGPRLFADQSAIFGPNMSNDWSGAIIYEWIQEANKYGLISYGSASGAGDIVRSGTPTPIAPDFTNLQSQWATLHPTGVASSAYNADSVTTPACPSSTSGGWEVNGNVALPTLGATIDLASAATISQTQVPSATASASKPTGSAKSSASSLTPKGFGIFSREVTTAGAALFGVMMVFAFWL